MNDTRKKVDEWKELVERLPLAVYTAKLDSKSTTDYISPRIERMLGFSMSDYASDPDLWLRLIHESDRTRVLDELRYCHEVSGTLETEYRMITRDEEMIWVSDIAEVISDETDSAGYLIGVLLDITDRKDFQVRLEESEAKYRHLVENTSDLVVKIDPEGKFLFISHSFCQLFGKTEKDLLGQQLVPLIHVDDQQCMAFAMKTLYRPPYTTYVELRAQTKSGWRWLAWKNNAIIDPDGNVLSIIGIGRDVTKRRGIEEELKRSKAHLQETQAYAKIGYWELLKGGKFADWSDEIYQIFGIEKTSNAGPDTLEKLVHPSDCPAVLQSLKKGLSEGIEHHVDYRIIRPDGEERWIECKAKPVRDEDGNIEMLSGFLQDITERKKTEQALRNSEERFRIVATATNDVIYEWNTKDDELHWYGDIDGALGYPPGGFPRTMSAWIDAIHPDDHALIETEIERIQTRGGSVDITYRIAGADGTWRIWRNTGQTVWSQDGRLLTMIGGCSDITDKKNAEEKVYHLAFHDSLTGLPNRLFFKQELQQALEKFRRDQELFALHYLDLDHFKDINDSLGHQVGDELLCEIVNRVKGITRGTDLFARLGGDEFGLIQSNMEDVSHASILASKIIRHISSEFQLRDKAVRINTSIGIVVPEDRKIDADDLLKKADTALYKAKDAGRGTYAFFHDSMTIRLQREIELVHYLSSAIKSNEFLLNYQPQYALANGRLVGLEALIRWNHPKRGLLLPGEFLPIAEKRGLIREISDWSLLAACRQTKQWNDKHPGFGRVAVNLCAMQVNSDDFYESTMEIFHISGVSPQSIMLEFTETVLVKATERTKTAIQKLSELGVQFAIDDFGTGFSSLSYLKNFRTDKIKIDREFIKDVDNDTNDAEIVKATIALGAALGLETVAEGVENQQQEAFLARHGCDQAQGFYYGRPMDASKIEELLEAETGQCH